MLSYLRAGLSQAAKICDLYPHLCRVLYDIKLIMQNDPFRQPLRKPWIPPEILIAPALTACAPVAPIDPRYALLINPFYAKDANASFGKHVLTPTLALTSFAATTPVHWRLEYWDENLLAGPPPWNP